MVFSKVLIMMIQYNHPRMSDRRLYLSYWWIIAHPLRLTSSTDVVHLITFCTAPSFDHRSGDRPVVNPGRGVRLADRTPLVSCPPVMPHTWTIVRREIYRSHKLNWPPEPLAAPHHPAGYPSLLTGGQRCFTGPQLDTRSSPWFYERLTSHALIKHWPLLLGDSFFMITYIAYRVSKAN